MSQQAAAVPVADAYAFRKSQRANAGRSAAVLAAVILLYYAIGLLIDGMFRTWADVIPPVWRGNLHIWTLVFQSWPANLRDLALWQKVPFATLTLLGFVALRTCARLRDPMRFYGPAMPMRNASDRGAHGAQQERQATLLNVVDEVCVAYGAARRPVVRIVDSVVPNALTVGYEADESTLVVTTALMDALTRNELRAVVAHELSHVYSGDARLGLFIAALTHWFQPLLRPGGFQFNLASIVGDDDADEDEDLSLGGSRSATRGQLRLAEDLGRAAPVLVAVLLVAVVTLAVSGTLYLLQRIGGLFASRSRDYLADARAVDALREHTSLGSALRKIVQAHQQLPDALEQSSFYAHQRCGDFFFCPEMAGVLQSRLWHPQPSLQERLLAVGLPAGRTPSAARWPR